MTLDVKRRNDDATLSYSDSSFSESDFVMEPRQASAIQQVAGSYIIGTVEERRGSHDSVPSIDLSRVEGTSEGVPDSPEGKSGSNRSSRIERLRSSIVKLSPKNLFKTSGGPKALTISPGRNERPRSPLSNQSTPRSARKDDERKLLYEYLKPPKGSEGPIEHSSPTSKDIVVPHRESPKSTERAVIRHHSNSGTRKAGFKSLSAEHMDKAPLTSDAYMKLPFTRKAAYTHRYIKWLHAHICDSPLENMLSEDVDTVVINYSKETIIQFWNDVGRPGKLKSQDIYRVKSLLTQKIFQAVQANGVLCSIFYSRIEKLKTLVFKALVTGKGEPKRTEWIDLLVDLLDRMSSNSSNSDTTILDSTDSVFKCKDDDLKRTVFSIFNDDPVKAEEVLLRFAFWNEPNAISKIKQYVDSMVQQYIDCHHSMDCRFTWVCTEEIDELVAKMDLEQVARSYLMGPKVNYDCIAVNSVKVGTEGISGSGGECQKQLFFRLLKMLYHSGLKPDADEKFIKSQVTNFLVERREFLGRDLLCLGSNGGWSLCDRMLRQLFPSLFGYNFIGRVQQGTQLYLAVLHQHTYALRVIKTYNIHEGASPDVRNSFSLKEGDPLCALEVHWILIANALSLDAQTPRTRYWESTIAIPKRQRLAAREQQWEEIKTILEAPIPVEGVQFGQPSDPNLRYSLDRT